MANEPIPATSVRLEEPLPPEDDDEEAAVTPGTTDDQPPVTTANSGPRTEPDRFTPVGSIARIPVGQSSRRMPDEKPPSRRMSSRRMSSRRQSSRRMGTSSRRGMGSSSRRGMGSSSRRGTSSRHGMSTRQRRHQPGTPLTRRELEMLKAKMMSAHSLRTVKPIEQTNDDETEQMKIRPLTPQEMSAIIDRMREEREQREKEEIKEMDPLEKKNRSMRRMSIKQDIIYEQSHVRDMTLRYSGALTTQTQGESMYATKRRMLSGGRSMRSSGARDDILRLKSQMNTYREDPAEDENSDYDDGENQPSAENYTCIDIQQYDDQSYDDGEDRFEENPEEEEEDGRPIMRQQQSSRRRSYFQNDVGTYDYYDEEDDGLEMYTGPELETAVCVPYEHKLVDDDVVAKCFRNWRTLLPIGVCLMMIVIAVPVAVEMTKVDDDTDYEALRRAERLRAVRESLIGVSTEGDLDRIGSPQNWALNWTAWDDRMQYEAGSWLLVQRYVMALLYYATNGDNWFNSNLWLNVGGNETCIWYGIECNDAGNVTGIGLSKNNLVGTIPYEIQEFTFLEDLDLFQNNIRGTIPKTMATFEDLHGLSLGKNKLRGTIPEGIFYLKNLVTLVLTSNEIEGQFPHETTLESIEILDVSFNKLTGTLPPSVGNHTSITHLLLSANKMNGTIPSEIGRLNRTEHFFLDNNNFFGTLPSTLSNLTQLKLFEMSSNSGGKINGTLPSFENWTMLEEFAMRSNQVTGSIPTEIGLATTLMFFKMGTNFLSGPIPSEIGNLKNLSNLELYDNDLTGTVPAELGNCTNLFRISIVGNEITGTVPREVCALRKEELEEFEADCGEYTNKVQCSLRKPKCCTQCF